MTGRVVVVIPCLNETAFIEGLVAQLARDIDDSKGIIVIADGGSTDGTVEKVQDLMRTYPHVSLLLNEKRLQSAAVNMAAKHCGEGFQYLARIDAHAGYPENYVSGLLRAAEASGAQSIVVPMTTVGKGCFQTAVAAAQNSVLGTGGSAHRHAGQSLWVDHGHHALFDLQWFLKVGGYDETFSHNEDAEFDARLVQAGGRIWLDGHSGITYYPRRDPQSLFSQYFNYGKGRARTVIKHKMPLKPRQLVPILIVPVCMAFVLGLWWPLLMFPFLIWVLTCLVYGFVLGLKLKDPCARNAGVAAIIMHFAWSAGFLKTFLFRSSPQVV